NFGLGQAGADLARRLDAVDQWQRVVEHGNIRLGLCCLVDRILAIAGFGDDLPARLRLKDFSKPRTHNLVVVGNENADHLSRRSIATRSPRSLQRKGRQIISLQYCVRLPSRTNPDATSFKT